MSWLDLAFAIPLIWGVIRGLYKGLIMSVGSLVGLVLGIYVASIYSIEFSHFLNKWFVLSEDKGYFLSFLLLFIIVSLVSFFIASLLNKFVKLATLAWLNRLLGAIFGFLKYALIISVLLNLYLHIDRGGIRSVFDKNRESVLYQPLSEFVPTLMPYVEFYVN